MADEDQRDAREGMSLEQIADKLNKKKSPTIRGTNNGQLHLFGRHSFPKRFTKA